MKKTSLITAGLVLAFAGASAFVRFAPSNPSDWHVLPPDLSEGDFSNSAVRILDGDKELFEKLHGVILATDNTTVLAGSVGEGMITYISRSTVMGFPDYTTIQLSNNLITAYARARYGLSDLGVNAKRLNAWLAQL